MILGGIVKLGNILNAGGKKGQADGFEIKNLSNATSIQDKNKHSILKVVVDTIMAEETAKKDKDDSYEIEFQKFKDMFEDCYKAHKAPLEDIKKNTEKVKTNVNIFKSKFDVICK